MKVLLNVIPQSQVAEEILEAMASSFDRFSQDRSFDFRLVRVDKFPVPPTYVERYDDACMSYWDTRNPHPSRDVMEPLLLRSDRWLHDEDCLRYAAVLYRSGDFGEEAHWGAHFYFLKFSPLEPRMFVRLNCRENITARDEAPNTLDIHGRLWLPDADRFSLPWVLAWAVKDIDLEGQWEYHPTHNPYPRDLVDEIVRDFHCFRSGPGEINTLSKKAGHNSDARRLLRYGWACAAMPSVRPSPFQGAGQHLAELFEARKTAAV